VKLSLLESSGHSAMRDPWERLERHNQAASRYPLAVLVWGPAPGDSIEYRKRCEIRDALNKAGHQARFSEDLIDSNRRADVLDEEFLQVEAADLVVVLYGSRGTQTEIDALLRHSEFAEKAIIFIHAELLPKALAGVAGDDWKKLQRRAQVIEYTTEELQQCAVVGEADHLVEKTRRAAYIAEIKRKKFER
jgi:hypothetical protein